MASSPYVPPPLVELGSQGLTARAAAGKQRAPPRFTRALSLSLSLSAPTARARSLRPDRAHAPSLVAGERRRPRLHGPHHRVQPAGTLRLGRERRGGRRAARRRARRRVHLLGHGAAVCAPARRRPRCRVTCSAPFVVPSTRPAPRASDADARPELWRLLTCSRRAAARPPPPPAGAAADSWWRLPPVRTALTAPALPVFWFRRVQPDLLQ